MPICTECKEEREWYHGRKCKECRRAHQRKSADKRYSKECPICKSIFIGMSPECSRKCKIMNRTIRKNCWEWQGKINESGYGCFQENMDKKRIYLSAHRVSYEEYVGKISEGMCVLHRCDNPKCCNPEHLWLGTPQDNVKDRQNKGRGADSRGEKHARCKLTEIDVLKIRKMFSDGIMQKDIAKIYNLHNVSISDICTRKNWQHI